MENREQEKGKEKKKENDEQRTGKEKQGMKVYRSSCFVSKAFFLTRITTGGTDYQNKNGQCQVKKSKTTLVLEIQSLHQRACEK